MGNLVKFGEYDIEAAREQSNAKKANNYMNLEEGPNVVRILPPPIGERDAFYEVRQHYVKPAGAERAVVFLCPRHMQNGKFCPACEQYNKYHRSTNTADQERAKELYPGKRVFCNVIDRKNPNKGPLILGLSSMTFKFIEAIRDDQVNGGNFTHPINGFDLTINREGTGLKTKYSVIPARAITQLHPDTAVMDKWYDQMVPLRTAIKVPTLEEINELFGTSREEEPTKNSTKIRTAQDDIMDADYT